MNPVVPASAAAPQEARRPRFPRTVWLLGWVSLATDTATEAVYPLLPLFLTQVLGAGAVSLGLVEGGAEAVNSLLKVWSGRASDRARTKRPLVLAGYAVSSLARPLIALATAWPQVLAVRVLDRVGKGIRSAPRDAMLAAAATPETRGRVFGFHRAMDHTGAILGPVLASIFLLAYPGQYRTLFALAIVPGAVSIGLLLLVREEPTADVRDVRLQRDEVGPGVRLPPPREALPASLRHFFVVLALFAVGNSTDAFLLLALGTAAGSVAWIPLLWAALHVVKASVSLVGGAWSDRIGRRRVIAVGWMVYAAVYVGFALSSTFAALVAWFLVYGVYFGLTEGVEKAWVADLAPHAARGYAFGIYNAVVGLGSLAASVLFGALWMRFGGMAAFGTGAGLAVAATLALLALGAERSRRV